jgi:hypothetical protein
MWGHSKGIVFLPGAGDPVRIHAGFPAKGAENAEPILARVPQKDSQGEQNPSKTNLILRKRFCRVFNNLRLTVQFCAVFIVEIPALHIK